MRGYYNWIRPPISDLTKVESTKHINQPIDINNKTLRRLVSHLDILSLGPIDVMDILGLSHSHDTEKRASRNPKSLSQAFLPATKEQICQCYANDFGI